MADTGNAASSTALGANVPSTAVPAAQSAPFSCPLLPSFSEACKLVNSQHSCLVLRTHRRPLALSPRYLNKKKSGIQEQLGEELLKYSSRLKGVPVAYDNIKIVGELGDIHDDVGYIHLNVQADFVLFQPKPGQKLVGIVNKVAPSHIGCLVHGCFNASIPRPVRVPIEGWQHIGVKIGDHLEFDVFRLDSDAVGVSCIRGKLNKQMEADFLQRINQTTIEQTCEVSSDTEKAPEDGTDTDPKVIPETQNVPECSSDPNMTVEETPKKKSKKRKYEEMSDFTEVDASIENISVEDGMKNVDGISKKVRKKRKHNDSLHNVDIDNNNIINVKVEEGSIDENESLVSSGQEPPKKSKKKKHRDNSEQGLNETLQNGTTHEQAFNENSLLDLSAESGIVENLKKKRKKKHKLSPAIDDSILDSTNGGTDFASQESLLNDLTMQQETPKQKKHKKKHLANVLAGNEDGAYLGGDRNLPAESQEFTEPKAKKKRKE
ncbi:DNA-directed RNA polymerase I subunit RPA43 [Pyxicephalus adspersus]|uniref:DNA-directed RNA polymerase subunit n=1 Tax=Pyxicephalus adspersus TaxID=30357 RepID=A0AAV3ADN2_PYXAD|nr:TPA: hypothetical protein GDO54_012606 [Pyxicephalus adspersus]